MSQGLAVSVGERYRLEQLLGRGGMGSVYRAYDRLSGQRVALKLVPVEHGADYASDGEHAARGSDRTAALSLDELTSEDARGRTAAQRTALLAQTVAAGLQAVHLGRSSRIQISVSSSRSSTNAMWARLALAQEFRTLASVRHPHIISVLDYGFVARSQPFFTMELLENAQPLSAASKLLPLKQKALLLSQLLLALSYLHRYGILHRDLKPAKVTSVEKSGRFVRRSTLKLRTERWHQGGQASF